MLRIIFKQVPPVDHQIFNKWEQLDGSIHCHSVVAYLEDENFGYIVEEYLENGKLRISVTQ